MRLGVEGGAEAPRVPVHAALHPIRPLPVVGSLWMKREVPEDGGGAHQRQTFALQDAPDDDDEAW